MKLLAFQGLLVIIGSLLLASDASAESRERHPRVRHAKPVIVKVLPRVHAKLDVHGSEFHVQAGVFYRATAEGFRVVPAPVGAVVNALPSGFAPIELRGSLLYYFYGTYYKKLPAHKGYVVVEQPPEHPREQDVVYLVGGQVLHGRLLATDEKEVRFWTKAGVRHIPLAEVVSVDFEPVGAGQ